LAVLGTGQVLRGDDAAGVLAVQRLCTRLAVWPHSAPPPLVIEAGVAIENTLVELRRFAPNLALVVDAVAADPADLPVGAVRLFSPYGSLNTAMSTHALPLDLFARYLRRELTCPSVLLGIQAGQTEWGAPLSPDVAQAADQVAAQVTVIAVTCT
jgi:hydrogenase 3 maturation protease